MGGLFSGGEGSSKVKQYYDDPYGDILGEAALSGVFQRAGVPGVQNYLYGDQQPGASSQGVNPQSSGEAYYPGYGPGKPGVFGLSAQEIGRRGDAGLNSFRYLDNINKGMFGKGGMMMPGGGGKGPLDFSGLGGRTGAAESLGGLKGLSTYDPAQFDFQGLPKQYGDIQYARGAQRLGKSYEDALKQQKEALGTRRPDLLFRASEQSGENLGRELSDLQSGISSDVLKYQTDLGVQQQLQQAAENLRSREFGFGAAKDIYGLGEDTRRYEQAQLDKALDYILGLYGQGVNAEVGSLKETKGGKGFLGPIGSALGTAAKVGSLFI